MSNHPSTTSRQSLPSLTGSEGINGLTECQAVLSDRSRTPLLRTGKAGGGSCERVLLFPGSFNPFTRGHANLVERALQLFDEVVIAVGINEEKADSHSVEARVASIQHIYKDNVRVRVESYTGLTADFARSIGAKAILRGVRTMKDFEYEMQMADINRQLTGIDTVCLFAEPALAAISSSLVRELAHFGKDVSDFLPIRDNK